MMYINEKWLLEVAEREAAIIKDISHPINSLIRFFSSKEKMQKDLEKCIISKAKLEMIEEIMAKSKNDMINIKQC